MVSMIARGLKVNEVDPLDLRLKFNWQQSNPQFLHIGWIWVGEGSNASNFLSHAIYSVHRVKLKIILSHLNLYI